MTTHWKRGLFGVVGLWALVATAVYWPEVGAKCLIGLGLIGMSIGIFFVLAEEDY